MTGIQHQRIWLLVAAIAIVAVLFLLLAPQTHAGNPAAWLILLPVYFVGLLLPVGPLWRTADLTSGRAPESAFQRSSFQRPPPFRLG